MPLLTTLLSWSPIDRTRRNHGLEHATVTLLGQKYPGRSLAGRSTPFGFYIYGEVDTEELTTTALEALRRLRGGEHQLAIHPNCGTNFLTAGAVATGVAFAGFLGARDWRSRLERLPLVTLFVTIALIFAQPLGLTLQRTLTTSGIMGGLKIASVMRAGVGPMAAHFVKTVG